MAAHYTPGEVLWLLQMGRTEAIDYDAHPRDSCADLSSDPHGGGSSSEDQLPVIARWLDVQRARQAIASHKADAVVLELRANGFTEEEVARLVDLSQPTVNRRFRASLGELVEALGATDEAMAAPVVSMCLTCGEHARVRLREVRRKVKGGYRIVHASKLSACCVFCLTEPLVRRVDPKVRRLRLAA